MKRKCIVAIVSIISMSFVTACGQSANVKQNFTWLGKNFFTWYGEHFFTRYGKELFTLFGKEIFTWYGKQFFTSPYTACSVR